MWHVGCLAHQQSQLVFVNGSMSLGSQNEGLATIDTARQLLEEARQKTVLPPEVVTALMMDIKKLFPPALTTAEHCFV